MTSSWALPEPKMAHLQCRYVGKCSYIVDFDFALKFWLDGRHRPGLVGPFLWRQAPQIRLRLIGMSLSESTTITAKYDKLSVKFMNLSLKIRPFFALLVYFSEGTNSTNFALTLHLFESTSCILKRNLLVSIFVHFDPYC